MKIFDRYSLLCFSVALMIMMTLFLETEEVGEEKRIGVVYDVDASQSGYVFYFEDSYGERMRCFVRAEPAEFGVYAIKGSFSDDGGLFFVNKMEPIESDEV
jgi:hypothetical protein